MNSILFHKPQFFYILFQYLGWNWSTDSVNNDFLKKFIEVDTRLIFK